MGEGLQDYDALMARLAAVGCPYKLYVQRLRALEVVLGEPLVDAIATVILDRLPAAGAGRGWPEQFERDLRTFGLMEAILYFHDYPPLSERFLEDACALYERLGRLYLERHDELRRADDPRILVQLHFLHRLGDSGEHATPRPRQPPRRPLPRGIAPASEPEPERGYERRLPLHPELLSVGRWLVGRNVAPAYGCFADELCEAISAEYTFEGFPGVQAAFFDVAEILEEHGVDPFGGEGQYVLETMISRLGMEMFGDYERWIPCPGCGESHFVEPTLGTVNASLLAGGWLCAACGEGGGG